MARQTQHKPLAAVTGQRSSSALYAADDIVDAPEHYAYARAMGLLTWGSWDTQTRPFEDRLRDFMQAFPMEEPARFQGSMLTRTVEGEYGPAEQGERRRRLEAVALAREAA